MKKSELVSLAQTISTCVEINISNEGSMETRWDEIVGGVHRLIQEVETLRGLLAEKSSINETTDPESGAPCAEDAFIRLAEALKVRPESSTAQAMLVKELGNQHWSCWFEKNFYHQNKEECKAFLFRLGGRALNRGFKTEFMRNCLHIRK